MGKVLCIIPARGGSKGVKNKNIIDVNGKPLIGYTIETALEYFKENEGEILVSTDSDLIIQTIESYDVIADKRPSHLAEDQTPITDVIHYLLEKFDVDNEIDYILLLQPTAPIRESFHLKEALNLLEKNPQENALISVCEMDDVHPARMYKIEGNDLIPYLSEFENARRQDLTPAYLRNGSIYLCRKKAFLDQNTIMAKPSMPFIMDKKYLANIDDEHDLIVTRALVKNWLENK